ncbi:lmo0937 family membrane protein [Clostridium sp.]|uniref:lmo0937 family membrane protein n=1 Tax=Clostridium sp. TaxID=1506 RepID=UPI001A43E236|nr:lmo0937 family membrane protein [Clostridium sp.]MBK5239982.1 lmo0937 family membrane protein [Clostridium sp.]
MGFLSWIGGIVLFFWVLGLVFSVGGLMIHWLLVIAAIVFIVSMITGKSRRT